MAYAPSALLPRSVSTPQIAQRKARSLLQRFFDAIERSQTRRAEREIARYFAIHGDKFTDDVEREIERRFLTR